MVFILVWVWCAHRCYKVGVKYLAVYIGIFSFIILMLYRNKITNSCYHLNDSLVANDRYSESGGECSWVKSEICWNYTFDGFLRHFHDGKGNCKLVEDDLTEHKKIMGSEKTVSYPLITKFSYEERYQQFLL